MDLLVTGFDAGVLGTLAMDFLNNLVARTGVFLKIDVAMIGRMAAGWIHGRFRYGHPDEMEQLPNEMIYGYLDAFVPNDGDSIIGLAVGNGRHPAQVNEEWLVPAPERKFDDPNERRWVSARRMPHPLGCFSEPVRLLRPIEEHAFTRTYIKATLDPPSDNGADVLWKAAERAKASPEWRYKVSGTTQMVASNQPEELSEMLLEYAKSTQPCI